MSTNISPNEPYRQVDLARLSLEKLRIEDGTTLGAVYQHVTETAAATLNVERVGVWLLVGRGQTLRCVDLFERSKATHSAGVALQMDDFPEYFAALEQRKTLPAEVALSDPRTNALSDAYLIPLGITSVLDASIYIGGEVVGIVSHEHTGPPREWSSEERDFAGSMADLLAKKMRAAEMEEARAAIRTQALQLAEAHRIDLLAQMAAGVAHDFNNILTMIMGGAALIEKNPTNEESVTRHARQITEASQRGAALAKELITFARPGPKSSRVVHPAQIIAAQLPLLQAAVGSRHQVNLDVQAATGRVLIAPDQLERVGLNLVVNARDAMPDGGSITVSVDEVVERHDDGKSGWFVLIEVSDHGSGIPSTVLARIFDPFFTTKPRGQGTGLGLAVVHHIVSYSGGFVRVETSVDQGSTFRVYLPRVSSG